MLLGLLLRLAPACQQQQQQRQDNRTTADQPHQQRIGQQFVVGLLGCRLGRGFIRGRGRCSIHRCRRRSRYGLGRRGRGRGHQLRRQRLGRSSLRRRAAFSLQLGQLIVLQFDQALQLVHLALQVGHAAFQLGIVPPGGVQAFLGHRQLVTDALAIADRAFTGFLARLGRDQAQTVAGRTLRRSRVRRTTGGIQLLGLGPWHITTALAPGFVLRSHLGNGLGLGQLADLRGIRQAQDLAGLQAVDVAIDEGIRVQRLDRQHGLLDRTAVARLRGDVPQGVAGHGGVLCRRPGHRRIDRRCSLSGRLGCLRRELGRVEQHAVVAQQAAIGPHHLDQELDHGFGQWLAGGHPQNAFAIGIEHRGKGQVIEERLAVHAGLGEVIG